MSWYNPLTWFSRDKSPRRPGQVTKTMEAMQLDSKGVDKRERGFTTQVSLPQVPYDQMRQRWDRKQLLEQVNRYVQTDPRLARANTRTARAAIGSGVNIRVQGAQGRSRAAKDARRAQEIINQLVKDVRLNARLVSWVRLLMREGELDLNVLVDHRERRVVGINRLPTFTIRRNEDETGQFPDLERAFTQVDPLSQEPLRDPVTGQERHFPLYALNSIRFEHDDGELYGTSMFAPGLRYAQMLQDIEDQMFIRRMVRAGLKYIFSVVRGDGSPAGWEEVKAIRDENKEFEDPAKLKEAVVQNLWANQQVKAEAIQGDANLDEIDDVLHVQEQLWVSAGMPKGLLGYGEQINRDVLKEQQEEHFKDLDAVCFLLEHGDGGPYSGLRAIIDFALAIQGINPDSISYAMQWAEHTVETKGDRADYVTKLRDKKLISRRKALHMLSADLDLDGEADIEAMLAELEDEEAADGPEPNNTSGGLIPADDALPFAAGDAPREALSLLAMRMGRAVRDRGLRVWRRVQKHPDLHPLLEDVARELGALTPASTPRAQEFHDAAECDCGHYHTEADAGKEVLTESASLLLSLVAEVLEEEPPSRLRAIYLSGARTGAREAALMVPTERRRGRLPRGAAAAITETIPDRWEGINQTTLGYLRKELAAVSGANLDTFQLASVVKDVLEMPVWRIQCIADTEIVWGYHQGALTYYDHAGVQFVQRNELPYACPACAGAKGSLHTVGDARAILPSHPGCYGWWSPVT